LKQKRSSATGTPLFRFSYLALVTCNQVAKKRSASSATWDKKKINERGGGGGVYISLINSSRVRGASTTLALPCLHGGGGGGVVIMEEIKQPCTLAFGAFRVILREHHIHEAPWASHKHHWCSLRATRVSESVILAHLWRHTWAWRGCWWHCCRPAWGLHSRVHPWWW